MNSISRFSLLRLINSSVFLPYNRKRIGSIFLLFCVWHVQHMSNIALASELPLPHKPVILRSLEDDGDGCVVEHARDSCITEHVPEQSGHVNRIPHIGFQSGKALFHEMVP